MPSTTDRPDAADLTAREAAFRRGLDPQMSVTAEAVAVQEWLQHQPEAAAQNRAVVAGQLVVAVEALEKAKEAASYLPDHETTVWELSAQIRSAWLLLGAFRDR